MRIPWLVILAIFLLGGFYLFFFFSPLELLSLVIQIRRDKRVSGVPPSLGLEVHESMEDGEQRDMLPGG